MNIRYDDHACLRGCAIIDEKPDFLSDEEAIRESLLNHRVSYARSGCGYDHALQTGDIQEVKAVSPPSNLKAWEHGLHWFSVAVKTPVGHRILTVSIERESK